MNSLQLHPSVEKRPISLSTITSETIRFYCAAPHAQSVELIGDFNQGRPLSMQRTVDGWWFAKIQLSRGCYQYRYRVDGRDVLDPNAARVVRNELNEPMSLVAVS